jgi:hypothetical protein
LPYTQAQIYARVTGYVKKWDADIGTPVKAGQLLAELASVHSCSLASATLRVVIPKTTTTTPTSSAETPAR